MINTGDYPLGAANDPDAPYNEKENPEIEVSLYVWYDVGKRITVKTSDYKLDEWFDEDGYYRAVPIFDDTDFWPLIEEQCPLPEGFDITDADYTIE